MEIEEKICPIWGTEAEIEFHGYLIEYDSPRAGGKYQIADLVYPKILEEELTEGEKIKLTDWLVDQREAGVEVPEIDEDVLQDIKTRPDKPRSECIKSLMLFLAKKYEIGEDIINDDYTIMLLKAYSNSSTKHEIKACLDHCDEKKHLKREVYVSHGMTAYSMTVEGKIFAEEIRKEKNQKSGQKEDEQNLQCFVAMWFDENVESMEDVYEKVIEPAIRDAGYEAYRVDKHRHNERIDVKIIEQIDKSRFMIADFTSEEDKPRGGVYYEAGYAHGRGLEVIRTCRKDRMDGVHFDIKHYQFILWKADDLQGFYDEIYLSIREIIGDSENTKKQGTSFSQ